MPNRNKNNYADLYGIQEKVDALLKSRNEKLQSWTDQRDQCSKTIEEAEAAIAGFNADTDVNVYMAAVDRRTAAEVRLDAIDKRIAEIKAFDLIDLDEYNALIDKIQATVTEADNAAFKRICDLMDEVYAIGEEYQDVLNQAQRLMDSLFFDVRPTGPTHVKKEKQRYVVGDLDTALRAHYATREIERTSRSQPSVSTARYGKASVIKAVNDGCEAVETSSNRSAKKYRFISSPVPRKK